MDVGPVAFGVFGRPGEAPRVGARVGDAVVDMAATTGDPVFELGSLNAFMAGGPAVWREAAEAARGAAATFPNDAVEMHLPFEVADYVDFYASRQHAEHAGRIFRPGTDPLPAQWLDMPLGYHGRAGGVVVSGTPVRRPSGQLGRGVFGPTRKLDIEAEVGFVVGVPARGPVRPDELADHVFGVVLLNDWSARDIQAFEARPLGPFLGKAFATSISAWVTPLGELLPATGPAQDPPPLPHLKQAEPRGYAIELSVGINGHVVSRPQFADMYWSPGQQLAHLTSGGASIRTGDLFASGTVSSASEPGSLLELFEDTVYLADGDTVVIAATGVDPVWGTVSS